MMGYAGDNLESNQERLRVAYYQGGDYGEYNDYLKAMVSAFSDTGLIDLDGELSSLSSFKLWNEVSVRSRGGKLEFIQNGFYSSGWDAKDRLRVRDEIRSRVRSKSDIDLIIAMGTWAAKDLAGYVSDIPILVVSSSNPVEAGIVKNQAKSGVYNVFAHVDPNYYERQIRLLYRIFPFRKLGMIYEDSTLGRSYSAIEKIRSVSAQLDYELIECHAISDTPYQEQAEKEVVDCFEYLSKHSDAIYITAHGGVSENSIPILSKIARENRVVTLSEVGKDEVKYGFLLSLSRVDKYNTGIFIAESIIEYMNGVPLNELDQIFQESLKMSINLKTAEEIGLYLYADTLAAADKIYYEIEAP
ncbi:ABC transporter substrate-binding protein [Marinobacterium jannaschii]|uniref:ABC transporter substrate-binding protein n=1 Tax=Marinobacterium jannaschii TaxID=64970 RepID=UPI001471A0A1|nr:ABC transporter substrate binding protein [Marinobacterium jannaschii]